MDLWTAMSTQGGSKDGSQQKSWIAIYFKIKLVSSTTKTTQKAIDAVVSLKLVYFPNGFASSAALSGDNK